MVFFSTFQALLGLPLSRSVFAFGTRQITQRIVVEEIVMGLLLVLPLSFLISCITIRIAASGKLKPPFIKHELWTTFLITVVGDMFLEILLPSLQCLPIHHPFSTNGNNDVLSSAAYPPQSATTGSSFGWKNYFIWLAQAWGFACPKMSDGIDDDGDNNNNDDDTTNAGTTAAIAEALLSTDAVGTLLTIRLIFMCCGIYVGESLLPVALTGGIACGKTTVANLLSNNSNNTNNDADNKTNKGKSQQQSSTGNRSSSTTKSQPSFSTKSRKQKKKGGGGGGQSSSSSVQTVTTTNPASSTSASSSWNFFALDKDEEGTFLIIDTDKIAHEILLPPSVLRAREAAANAADSSATAAAELAALSDDPSIVDPLLKEIDIVPDLSDTRAIGGGPMRGGSLFSATSQSHSMRLPQSTTASSGSGGGGGRSQSTRSMASSTTSGGGGGGSSGSHHRHSSLLSQQQRQSQVSAAASPSPYIVRPSDSVYDKVVDAFSARGAVDATTKETTADGNDVDDDDDGDSHEGEDVGGYDIMDDEHGYFIDRTKLGAIIFANPALRRKLNRITHPRIMLCLLMQIFRGIFATNADVVCCDVPLLYESGYLKYLFGIVIVVAASPKVQYERLQTRNPELSEKQCWDRINSQYPIEMKVKEADIVIWNNNDDDMEALAQEVERVRRDVMGRIYGIGMSLLQMLLLVGGSLSLAVSSKLFSSWS